MILLVDLKVYVRRSRLRWHIAPTGGERTTPKTVTIQNICKCW